MPTVLTCLISHYKPNICYLNYLGSSVLQIPECFMFWKNCLDSIAEAIWGLKICSVPKIEKFKLYVNFSECSRFQSIFELCILELGFNLNVYSEWESGPIYPGLNLWCLFNVTLIATKVAPPPPEITTLERLIYRIHIHMIDIYHIYVCVFMLCMYVRLWVGYLCICMKRLENCVGCFSSTSLWLISLTLISRSASFQEPRFTCPQF